MPSEPSEPSESRWQLACWRVADEVHAAARKSAILHRWEDLHNEISWKKVAITTVLLSAVAYIPVILFSALFGVGAQVFSALESNKIQIKRRSTEITTNSKTYLIAVFVFVPTWTRMAVALNSYPTCPYL